MKLSRLVRCDNASSINRCCGKGLNDYLWSTAGDEYAAHAARILGVEDVVRGRFGKRSVPEDITVDFAVDDQPSWVEEHGGLLVKAYDGCEPDLLYWHRI